MPAGAFYGRDFIIGGILAWDGQLLDNHRYTWDLDAELDHSEEWVRAPSRDAPLASLSQIADGRAVDL